MLKYLLSCAALFVAAVSFAHDLSGTVTDEWNAPLAGVTIALPALQRGTVSNAEGQYRLQNLPTGQFTVEFSLLGYRRETRTANVAVSDLILNIALFESPLELAPVTVTATPQPSSVQHSTQSVTVIEGRHLDRQRGQAVMEAVKSEPGVALFTTGAIAKPVIRGLSSQRVLVVADGIRQEGQQWGDEHGPELDALDVERIEVVRGPNSVLYGSDALGGVVNVIRSEVPTEDDAPALAGTFHVDAHSANEQAAGAIELHGASGLIGYRAHYAAREADDMRTRQGTLFNSGLREQNVSGALGIHRDWGTAAVDYSHVGQEIEIHEDPAEDPSATPYQKIAHDRVHVHTNFPANLGRLELHGGWQQNDRQEFELADAAESVVHLKLTTLTLDAKAHHRPIGRFLGTAGVSVMNQTNETLGEEALIPNFDLADFAGYLFEELNAGAVSVSAGARFDVRTLDADVAGEDMRDYNAVTGTLGAVWRIQPDLSWTVSAGRGWRAPTAFELFAYGVHEGTQRFEIGDPDLDPEASLNLETGLRYHSPRLRTDLSLFRNTLARYIYPSPTGEVLEDHDVYEYAQADAVLTGAELDFELETVHFLVLTGGADMVRGDNSATDDPLPLMPADRARAGFRVVGSPRGFLRSPYVSFNATMVADQERLDANETRTAGYTLFDVGAGAELQAGGQRITLDISVENLFDRKYRSHLSRYKTYALDPGRNMMLKVGVPFTIVR